MHHIINSCSLLLSTSMCSLRSDERKRMMANWFISIFELGDTQSYKKVKDSEHEEMTYRWPTSWAATMIPENPPLSSMMATLFTFSSRLLTTQAPPTYAKPAVPLLHRPPSYRRLHMSSLVITTAKSYVGNRSSLYKYLPMSVRAPAASTASALGGLKRFRSRYGVASLS